MTYTGGKNGAGVFQAIINQMPPHRHYIEPFAGSGAVIRRKKPAAKNIAFDLDPRCADFFEDRPEIDFETGDGLLYVTRNADAFQHDDLIYFDPPYVRAARSTDRDLYAHEMGDLDHVVLLDLIKSLRCMVMISGYHSELYADRLNDWRVVTFTGQTRGGPRTEYLWCNFSAPAALHDPRYLGDDYRERERIRRKALRWASRFAGLPPLERQAVISLMLSTAPPVSAVPDSDTL